MPPKSKNSNTPRCPACNHSIKTSFNANLHPLLKVLVCRECYFLYGTGDFTEFDNGVDENGDDNYCRLCVDGGELYFCANSTDTYSCHYGFCRDCIEKINPQDPLINDELNDGGKWKCLVCEESKTAEARREAQETLKRLNIGDLDRNVVVEEVNGNANKKPRHESSPEPKASQRSGPSIDLTSHIVKERPRADSDNKPSATASDRPVTKTSNPPAAPEKRESQKTSDSQQKKVDNSKQDKPAATAPIPTKQKSGQMSEKPVPATEKSKAAKAELIPQREPEAISMPPVEKPKPPKTSLRTLGPRSSLSSAMHSTSTTNRDEETRTSLTSQKPARVSSESRPPLKQNQSIRSELVTSKKLKVSRQTVESCILLSEPELKNRLKEYEMHKNNHIKRVSQHFDSIVNHFDTCLNSKGGDDLMKSHIDSMRRSVHDINNMFADLESLWAMRSKKV